MTDFYIGIMTGTSCDGIDAVLVDFTTNSKKLNLLATHSKPYPPELRQQLTHLAQQSYIDAKALFTADVKLGQYYAEATHQLLAKVDSIDKKAIKAIGCHGQTLWHAPSAETPYTVQIGDANTVAALTGITTVADFRRKDLAFGGQGAPLAPAFHHFLFSHPKHTRAVINIGGFSNISILPTQGAATLGFDTGPGNVLLDGLMQKHFGCPFDKAGKTAASGHLQAELLVLLQTDPYFALAAPKSTGRDYFNEDWLTQMIGHITVDPADLLCTLTELTAWCISKAIDESPHPIQEAFICGGGAYNEFLMDRLQARAPCPVYSTMAIGYDPRWIEAMTFAWLAKQTLERQAVKLNSITGSSQNSVLGGIFHG